jgi:hypothetical protein
MTLAIGMWLSCSGCVAADQPTFQEPGQTPPFLLAKTADPAVTQPYPWDGKTRDLKVDVRSEDLGDPLVAKLVLNYARDNAIDLGPSGTFPASTLSDPTKRTLLLTLDPATFPPAGWTGCQQVSLVVTHLSKVTIDNGIKFPKSPDDTDTGVITWWLNIPDPNGAPSTMDRCSQPSGTSP